MPFERSRSATIAYRLMWAFGLTLICHQVATGLRIF
jgi:hypothetical protein